jgi:hypothetical protein
LEDVLTSPHHTFSGGWGFTPNPTPLRRGGSGFGDGTPLCKFSISKFSISLPRSSISVFRSALLPPLCNSATVHSSSRTSPHLADCLPPPPPPFALVVVVVVVVVTVHRPATPARNRCCHVLPQTILQRAHVPQARPSTQHQLARPRFSYNALDSLSAPLRPAIGAVIRFLRQFFSGRTYRRRDPQRIINSHVLASATTSSAPHHPAIGAVIHFLRQFFSERTYRRRDPQRTSTLRLQLF